MFLFSRGTCVSFLILFRFGPRCLAQLMGAQDFRSRILLTYRCGLEFAPWKTLLGTRITCDVNVGHADVAGGEGCCVETGSFPTGDGDFKRGSRSCGLSMCPSIHAFMQIHAYALFTYKIPAKFLFTIISSPMQRALSRSFPSVETGETPLVASRPPLKLAGGGTTASDSGLPNSAVFLVQSW